MTLPVFFLPSLAAVAEAGGPSGLTGSGDDARPGRLHVLELTGDEARHAVVVRRIRVGEQIAVTDGAGRTAVCRVEATTRSSLTASVLELSAVDRDLVRVTVVQGIPKGERGELAVEMLTEVGVDLVVPWAAARSVAVWRGDRAAKSVAKWRSAAHEAAKQSRRSWFPSVTEPAGTSDVVSRIHDADLAVVLHESAETPLASLDVPVEADVLVVVGPEGGIDERELRAFAEAGARVVRLGPSVLRTSTAGVAAVAVLLSRTHRWR